MDALTQSIIYTALMFGGGFAGGLLLAISWYERRWKAGIEFQKNREYQWALDQRDATEHKARLEEVSVERMAELARMQ